MTVGRGFALRTRGPRTREKNVHWRSKRQIGKKRVLIVDDDADFVDYVCDVVEAMGCIASSLTASTGFEKAFESFNPDVIVLDVTMPLIDGIEIINSLATRKSRAQIIITSGFDPFFSSAAQQIGETKGLAPPIILNKPFEPGALQALVADAQTVPAM